MAGDVTEQIAKLATRMEAGFSGLTSEIRSEIGAVNRRLDDHRDTNLRMHDENSGRLDLINGKVGKAHDRVAVVEVKASEMSETLLRIRKRGHEIANQVQALMNRMVIIEKSGGHRVFSGAQGEVTGYKDLMSRAPSLETIVKIASAVAATIYGTYWVMTAMGFHR